METLLFLPKIDAEKNNGKIHSRIGLEADAVSVDVNFNFFNCYSNIGNASKIYLGLWSTFGQIYYSNFENCIKYKSSFPWPGKFKKS